jgi:hypothetical protein
MRFETSQTTPSYLDRRLQLRMLSFVGLIAVVMISLSVMNRRPALDGEQSQRQYDGYQTYEARREPLTLKEDEVIIQTGFDDEPSRRDLASEDRKLFKPRRSEQSDDNEMFAPRTRPSRDRTDPQWTDVSADDDVDRSQPIDDPSDSFSSNEPVRAAPIRSNVPDSAPVGAPLRDDPSFDDDPVIERPTFGRRSRNSFDSNDSGTVGSITDETPPDADPINEDGRKDLYITDPLPDSPDAEPFQEDYDSVRFDKGFLDQVRDNDLGIRKQEADAYYWLLDHVRRVPPAKLEQAGLREIQYINLMTDPDRFRGEPITIEGDLWRLDEYDAGRNRYGVNRMYVGWVFTSDSGNHPYRVVCTSLGRGIQPGVNIRKPIRLTGYFFKREAYLANGGSQIAPTLIARRIGMNPMPNGIPMMAGILPYMLVTIMAVGLALLVTVIAFAIGDERSMQAGLKRLHRHPHVSFAGMGVPIGVSVEESLREFAERERQSAISGAYGPLLSRQTAREHAVHDYATSKQVLVNEGQLQHRRKTNALQDWASRQKENQAEIDAMRAGKKSQSPDVFSDGDELNSDKLAPARNILPKAQSTPTPVLAPLAQEQYVSTESHMRAHAASSTSHSVVSQPVTNHLGHLGSNAMELSAAAQIERDRLAREQQIRDQIHRQQVESERHRMQQLAHERAEHERLEHERQQREQHERERLAHERHTFDRAHHATDAHGTSRSAMTTAEQLEHEKRERERLEFERLEREHHERERLAREQNAVHGHGSTSHAHSASSTSHDHDRLERERLEHERHERERLERERHDHDHNRTHREFVRHGDANEHPSENDSELGPIDESEEHTGDGSDRKSKRRGGGWGWPQRRKNHKSADATSSDITEPDQLGEQIADEIEGEKHSGSGKRRGGWGWPKRRKHSESSDGTSETNELDES